MDLLVILIVVAEIMIVVPVQIFRLAEIILMNWLGTLGWGPVLLDDATTQKWVMGHELVLLVTILVLMLGLGNAGCVSSPCARAPRGCDGCPLPQTSNHPVVLVGCCGATGHPDVFARDLGMGHGVVASQDERTIDGMPKPCRFYAKLLFAHE